MAIKLFRTDGENDIELNPSTYEWGLDGRDNIEWVRLEVRTSDGVNLEIWDDDGVEIFFGYNLISGIDLIYPDEKKTLAELGLSQIPFRIEIDG